MEKEAVAVAHSIHDEVKSTISSFIERLLIDYDKDLNNKAQRRALSKETHWLIRLREQMERNKKFDSHYHVLGKSKEIIQYIDQKIDEILRKKLAIIQRYGQITSKEALVLIDKGPSSDRKARCDCMKDEIDRDVELYNNELEQLQTRRSLLWDARVDLLEYLIAQEDSRNQNLDKLYRGHTGLLEKIYVRHTQNNELMTLDMSKLSSLKQAFHAVNKRLRQYFKVSFNIAPQKIEQEKAARQKVSEAEQSMNDGLLSPEII